MTQRRDPELVARNREVRAFAREHGFRTESREDGSVAIPCWSTRSGRGYWDLRGSTSWAFYVQGRRRPVADAARLRALDPGFVTISAMGDELYGACTEAVALRLMLAEEPKFQTARRRRRLSPEGRDKAVRNLDIARRVLRAETPHSLHIESADVPSDHPEPRNGGSEGFLRSQAVWGPSGRRP